MYCATALLLYLSIGMPISSGSTNAARGLLLAQPTSIAQRSLGNQHDSAQPLRSSLYPDQIRGLEDDWDSEWDGGISEYLVLALFICHVCVRLGGTRLTQDLVNTTCKIFACIGGMLNCSVLCSCALQYILCFALTLITCTATARAVGRYSIPPRGNGRRDKTRLL